MLVTLARTIILYACVISAMRIMGKRQIGDMQPGELVVTFLISELASLPIQDTSLPIGHGLVAIGTLVAMEILVSFLAMKFGPIQRLINGHSGVLIKDGVIDQKRMKAMRVTIDDLMEVLRGQGVFDLSTVAYAILETNGQISILLKSAAQPMTRADGGAKKGGEQMNTLVVSDGKLSKEGLRQTGLTPEKVKKAAKAKGLMVKDVFLMTARADGSYFIIKKEP